MSTIQVANVHLERLYADGTKILSSNSSGAYYTGTINAASYTVGTSFIANTTGAFFNSVQLFPIPVGISVPFAGTTAPTYWLLEYGQNVSRSTYAALFTVIGTTYGSGDGTTTFGLPDMRGRVVAGKDDMGGSAASRLTNSGTGNPGVDGSTLGATGGVDRHTLTTAQMPSHTHTIAEWSSTAGGGASQPVAYAGSGAFTQTSGTTGNSNAHPTVPPTLIKNYIIFAGA